MNLKGEVAPVADREQRDALRHMYLQRHPGSYWVDFGDFTWFRMERIVAARVVGGFGRAGKVTDWLGAGPDRSIAWQSPAATWYYMPNPQCTGLTDGGSSGGRGKGSGVREDRLRHGLGTPWARSCRHGRAGGCCWVRFALLWWLELELMWGNMRTRAASSGNLYHYAWFAATEVGSHGGPEANEVVAHWHDAVGRAR